MGTKSAFKLGVVTCLMLISIAALLIWKSGIFLRATGYEMIGEFTNIQGLLNGAEVRYRGYKVGRISAILPDPKKISVHFWVEPSVKIPKGSALRIVFDGLIGERYIGIVPNPNSQEIVPPGSVIQGYATSGLADFVDVGTQNLEQTKAILETFKNAITGTDVSNAIKNTLLSVEKITAQLNAVVTELKTFSQTANISGLVDSISAIASDVRKTTDLLIKDGKVGQSVVQTANNFAAMSQNLKNISEDIQKIINETVKDDQVKTGLSTTLSETQNVLKKSSSLLKTIGSLDINADVSIRRYSIPEKTNFEINSNFKAGHNFLRIGFGDRLGSLQMINLEQGIEIADNITARFGILYNQAGFGFDYRVMPTLSLSSDFYNLNVVNIDFFGRYKLINHIDLLFGLTNILTDKGKNYLMGISYTTGP